MLPRIYYIALFLSFAHTPALWGQEFRLPQVFLIGEYEKGYEHMITNHPLPLLAVCDQSMEKAFKVWYGLIIDIENYSHDTRFELNGIKIWINVFWDKEGAIRHIAFYPKPVSRKFDFEEFENFLREFIVIYKLDVKAHTHFAHYGSMSFPVYRGKSNKPERD